MTIKDAAWRQTEPHLDGQRVSDCVDIAHIYHRCVWSRTYRSSIDVHMELRDRGEERRRRRERERIRRNASERVESKGERE